MLLKFRFKNYKSFAEDAILDMTATSNKEHIYTIIHSNVKKILPVAGLFGANGSGKSNFFDAFQTMCTEVLNTSNKYQSVTPSAFDTNMKKTPTEFEVSITIEDKKYRYGFSKHRKEIVEEWLFEQEVHSKAKCIFYTEKNTMHFKSCPKSEKEELCSAFDTLPKEKLLLTALGEREKSSYSKVYVWIRRTATYQYGSDSLALQMLEVLPKVKNDVLNLLQELDSSIVDLEVKQQGKKSYKVYFHHLNEKGDKVRIPLKNEAQGIQKMLSLAVWIILSQSTSLVLFVDDLDTHLHPLILRYILNLYINPDKNKNQSQLIFSSHNLNFSDLRKDEIWFVEKENQKSTMFSLSDFKTENNTDYEKHYLCGRYGAIPFI